MPSPSAQNMAVKTDNYAMIIGAMKSGTSTLFHLLSQHPEIAGSSPKEPEYFSDQLIRVDVKSYDDLWDFDEKRHRVKLEASTGYTKWPVEQDVPEKIRAAGLSPKFIYIVRDPIERIRSQWKHERRVRLEGLEPPSPVPFEGYQDPRIVALSLYHSQLARFRAVFPERERYLILEFSELKRPEALLKKCFQFLEVDPDFTPEESEAQNRAPPMSEIEARMFLSGWASKGRFLPQPLKKAIRKVLRTVRPDESTDLSADQHRQLVDLFESDVRKFSEEYGIDISHWDLEPVQD